MYERELKKLQPSQNINKVRNDKNFNYQNIKYQRREFKQLQQ
jgi:hypothetical protein